MDFEWDAKKADTNIKKHGISFSEAATVFGDPLAITFNDADHSIGEVRCLTFGRTITDEYVIVSHTECAGMLRIISARIMTKSERRIYEQD
jgi:uncharacterized protein